MIERQEIHCHNCDKYVQFDIDTSLNGRHVLNCPECGHEHCRIVKDGVITDERWDSRNANIGTMQTYQIAIATTSTVSTYDFYVQVSGTGNTNLYGSWMNTSTACG
jgi:DNA-directed RNA polymerase subunit RPC12/RpoP